MSLMEETDRENTLALASGRVVRDGLGVNEFYRERPISREDSGWRFFSGDETGEFIANPENMICYTLGEVLLRAPDVRPFLSREIGAAFERDAGGGFHDVTGKQFCDEQ